MKLKNANFNSVSHKFLPRRIYMGYDEKKIRHEGVAPHEAATYLDHQFFSGL